MFAPLQSKVGQWIIEKHRPRPRRQKYGKNQYGGEL